MDYIKKAEMIALWAQEKNATDIDIIDVTELTSVTDVFVFMSAANERQVDAINEHIYVQAKTAEFNIPSVEGKKERRWVLLDFGDVVVHIFHHEEREYYDIEKLWADGKFILLPDRK